MSQAFLPSVFANFKSSQIKDTILTRIKHDPRRNDIWAANRTPEGPQSNILEESQQKTNKSCQKNSVKEEISLVKSIY